MANFPNLIIKATELAAQINQTPITQQTLAHLKHEGKIALTYSSNALEGNELTFQETKTILEEQITIGGKRVHEHLEVVGHGRAYEGMWELIQSNAINESDILRLHKLLYGLIDITNAGVYRTSRVFVTGAEIDFPAPAQVAGLMKAFAQEIPELEKKHHPIEYAAILHLKFVNIHPFIDGNGRTARLLMNLALMQHGYVVTIVPPVLRSEYIAAIKAGNHNDYQPFINFLSNMVHESLKDYLRMIGVK